MPPKLKRPWASSSRSVSPPPSKRRALVPLTNDSTLSTIPSTHLRIFSWNVNGVNPLLQNKLDFKTRGQFPLREFLKRHRWPQVLCLQEVKINHEDDVTQRRLQHAANAGNEPLEPTYVVRFSLPRDRWNATGFGGRVHSVATLIREDVFHHVVDTRCPDWDLEGRVLIHEIDSGLIIINGYCVNGTTNLYRNPETGAEARAMITNFVSTSTCLRRQ